MSQMIPLKIADMAVESCNKEIARLLFEKAELQGRVIALEAELESEKAAYKALRASSFVTAVPSEEYEKLKAENARLKGEDYADTELGSLVPKYLLEHWITKAKDLEKTKNEYLEIGLTIDEENDRLKAEVERLRKAGDAMAEQIYNEGKVRGITFISNVDAWNAAKEGKPSI